jgi:phage tail-like protein
MDANGLRFWMLADADQWLLPGEQSPVLYDRERRALRLASQAAELPPEEPASAAAQAQARLELVPTARDAYGTRAAWDDAAGRIVAGGALAGVVPIWEPPTGSAPPTDLCVGFDGVLYIAINGGVTLFDLLDRWDPVTLAAPGFFAWRLAADPDGGVWVLDPDDRQIARVTGLPLRTRAFIDYEPDTPRPCEENPHPPILEIYDHAEFSTDEDPVAIACSPDGRLAVLCWRAGDDGEDEAVVRYLNEQGRWFAPCVLLGMEHPFSLAWASVNRIALLTAHLDNEAPAYPAIPGAASVVPVGDYYPLRQELYTGGPFTHTVSLPPHYPAATAETSLPLHFLSLPQFPGEGEAQSGLVDDETGRGMWIDSGSARTVWHRLYLEANLPPACGVRVLLAADDTGSAALDELDWHEHRFGELFRTPAEENIPLGAWVPHLSEIPHQPGLITCERVPHQAGLFTALVQRPERKVRALRGRYLYVRVVLHGDRRTTPEVWALRVYASRFSYVENYLPELYRETVFGPDADALLAEGERSTPADFLDRFVANFEGVLTLLEDRVANAHLLTDPRTAPPEALEWLGSWIGLSLETAYPRARQRRLLQAAPTLFKRRGTLAGLNLALDIATNGGVSGGEIIAIENWRFRRVFATILGADLADEDNPLLAGLSVSGNSYVGDTLILGEENRKEFLALFAAELEVSAAEADVIAALFDNLAYRVTVLVHESVTPQDLGLIRRIAALETPAHVITKVKSASEPFMVTLRSLVGIDSYLSEPVGPGPVRLGTSHVGVRDVLQSAPALDPRYGSGRSPILSDDPIANAGDDLVVEVGESFTLDGTRSRAAPGREIAWYVWTLLPDDTGDD